MTPALALIVALGLGPAEAPAPTHQHDAVVAPDEDAQLPRDCNSLVGEDGYYKVLVMHQARNRERRICTDWTAWDSFHANHGDYCAGDDAYGCVATAPTNPPEPTARPACSDQIGEDGLPKVLIQHCKPVGNGAYRCKVQCVDQTAWDLDHAFHPGDSLIP